MVASEVGQAEVVKQLISGGANANLQFTVRKYSCFQYYFRSGQVLCISDY